MTSETYNQIHNVSSEKCDGDTCSLCSSLPHGSGEYLVSVMMASDELSFLSGM